MKHVFQTQCFIENEEVRTELYNYPTLTQTNAVRLL